MKAEHITSAIERISLRLSLHGEGRTIFRAGRGKLREGQIRELLIGADFFRTWSVERRAPDTRVWHARIHVDGAQWIFVVDIDAEMIAVITSYPLDTREKRDRYARRVPWRLWEILHRFN